MHENIACILNKLRKNFISAVLRIVGPLRNAKAWLAATHFELARSWAVLLSGEMHCPEHIADMQASLLPL